MGIGASRLVKRLLSKRQIKLLMVGLDASGKTTILYKLKLGEVVQTIPTIDSCIMETLLPEHQGTHFRGGQQ